MSSNLFLCCHLLLKYKKIYEEENADTHRPGYYRARDKGKAHFAIRTDKSTNLKKAKDYKDRSV